MKTALITGASGGIGKEFAELFAKEGYGLVLVARSEKRLNDLAKDFRKKYKVKVAVLVQDLSKPRAALKVYNEIKKKRISVDTLVNNAGFGDSALFGDEDLKTVTEMIHLNITALTELTSLFLKDMKAKKVGQILNVASTAAFQPVPNMAVYAATKAFVLHFTEALHHELRDSDIKVSALCPGPTSTGFVERAKAQGVKFLNGGMDAAVVARLGYRGLVKNKMTVITGFKNKLMSLSRMVPSRSLLVRLVSKVFG